MFLRNVGIYQISPHDVTTHNTNIDNAATFRNSSLIFKWYIFSKLIIIQEMVVNLEDETGGVCGMQRRLEKYKMLVGKPEE
jgi:hypothetical protein